VNFLYLGIFIISSGIHLFASFKQYKPLRNVTKPIILLSLLGFYLESVGEPSWFLILALIFSWIGDVLLIPNGTKWFTAGGISFMISHVFFILAYCEDANVFVLDWYIYVIFGIVFAFLVAFIFKKLKPHLPKALFYPMALYLLINGTMNCFAIFRFFVGVDYPTIVTIIGAFSFFISDATLFFVRFKKDSKIKTHFSVMLTYSIAECLIILGFIL